MQKEHGRLHGLKLKQPAASRQRPNPPKRSVFTRSQVVTEDRLSPRSNSSRGTPASTSLLKPESKLQNGSPVSSRFLPAGMPARRTKLRRLDHSYKMLNSESEKLFFKKYCKRVQARAASRLRLLQLIPPSPCPRGSRHPAGTLRREDSADDPAEASPRMTRLFTGFSPVAGSGYAKSPRMTN